MIQVRVQPTPNPNALKFIVNQPVKTEGKATFTSPEQCQHVGLAADLFEIPGVVQLHFFDNFITVTFSDEMAPAQLETAIESVLQTRLPVHNPNFDPLEKKPDRSTLTPEVQQIESILDRTVRPGLRADGGDIEVVNYEEGLLTVNYQGACGTCPSAMMGTLEAIRGILADEFNPEIQIQIA